jgi:hypothetical protein
VKHVVIGMSALPIHGGHAQRLLREPVEVGRREQLTVPDHAASGLTTGDRTEGQGASGMEDVVLVLYGLVEMALTGEEGVDSEAVAARVGRFGDPDGVGEQLAAIEPGVTTIGNWSSKLEVTPARPTPRLDLVEILDRCNELARAGFEIVGDPE